MMTAAEEPALLLEKFGVAFGDRIVLSSVSLELRPKGLTTLVGPAGSGKSTLLRTLAGLNDAQPSLSVWGKACVAGRPIETTPPSSPGEVRANVGFVMQHARFFVDSVRENLVSALPNRASLSQAEQTRVVTTLLRENGLGELVPALGGDVASLSTPIQRRLAIVRALVSNPVLLMADEPTAELAEEAAVDVLALLRCQARFRSVVMVTHNQRCARALGGDIAVLAGGQIHEVTPASEFFVEPRTAVGTSFLRTGGSSIASPNAKEEDLAPVEERRPDQLRSSQSNRTRLDSQTLRAARSASVGPRGFFWVRPGMFGGLPRPGIVESVEHDIDGLKRLGITTLVTLEETMTVAPDLLERASIQSIHFPIVDMGAPSEEEAMRLCRRIRILLAEGEVVAMHCRAGQGRTGTMLACQLVFDGDCSRDAIERIRRLNPKCIESKVQLDFISAFEIRVHGGTAEPHTTPTLTPSS